MVSDIPFFRTFFMLVVHATGEDVQQQKTLLTRGEEGVELCVLISTVPLAST
jgi:hypothetical protein